MLDHTSEPGLRFQDYARSLADIGMKATESGAGAFTIGIYGKWGTGKTTLMRCIENEFCNRNPLKVDQDSENSALELKYKTIWFSPWKYDTKEKIWNALIQSILAEIEKAKNIDSEVRKTCQDLAWLMKFYAYEIGREIFVGLVKQQVKQNTGIDLAKLKELSHTDSLNSMYRGLNRFEEDFKELVKSYVGTDGRLIVFIDDLDRCFPDDALTVLEALKLYLDRSNCIFFIGLDRRAIEQAVHAKFSSSEIPITGQDYLEKMIQLNFFIPENDGKAVIDLLQGEMNRFTCHINAKHWELIGIATEQNLRRMKQYLISWNLVKELLPRDLATEQLQEIAVLLLLQMYFPKFYDALPQKGYTMMLQFATLLNPKTDSNAVGAILTQYPELKELYENDRLRDFVGRTSKTVLLDSPEKIHIATRRLSATGQVILTKASSKEDSER